MSFSEEMKRKQLEKSRRELEEIDNNYTKDSEDTEIEEETQKKGNKKTLESLLSEGFEDIEKVIESNVPNKQNKDEKDEITKEENPEEETKNVENKEEVQGKESNPKFLGLIPMSQRLSDIFNGIFILMITFLVIILLVTKILGFKEQKELVNMELHKQQQILNGDDLTEKEIIISDNPEKESISKASVGSVKFLEQFYFEADKDFIVLKINEFSSNQINKDDLPEAVWNKMKQFKTGWVLCTTIRTNDLDKLLVSWEYLEVSKGKFDDTQLGFLGEENVINYADSFKNEKGEPTLEELTLMDKIKGIFNQAKEDSKEEIKTEIRDNKESLIEKIKDKLKTSGEM